MSNTDNTQKTENQYNKWLSLSNNSENEFDQKKADKEFNVLVKMFESKSLQHAYWETKISPSNNTQQENKALGKDEGIFTVYDNAGNAGANNITINAIPGYNFFKGSVAPAATFVMSNNYESALFMVSSFELNVIVLSNVS